MISLTIPVFLLLIGGLVIWILVESKVNWIFKIISTTTICIFSIGLFLSLQTFLGWPSDSNLPEKVSIRWVIIKEPSPSLNFKGKIYLLLDSVKSKYDNKMLDLLGHKNEVKEPRLYSIPYSRELHKELEKNVIPRLKDGQIVNGKMTKSGKQGVKGKKGDGKDGKGGNSESQTQEYMFYNLPPSEIQPKNQPDSN